MERSHLPFGNPDGSRSDIEELLDQFVSFDPSARGLGMEADDLSWRVVSGAKGSGKTVYLRRMQASARRNPGVYADDIQNDLPATDNVVKFAKLFPHDITEQWTTAWTRSILRALASHLLHAPELRRHVSAEDVATLRPFIGKFVPESKARLSVYSQLNAILEVFGTKHRFTSYLREPAWAELETVLADILKGAPPVYFFLDSVDERYESAPRYWLDCQRGLFFAAMGLLRDTRLGSRLHVCIAIRDHVLSTVLRSEHASRYRGEPHIRALNWDASSIKRLMTEKLRRLPQPFVWSPELEVVDADLVKRWLGFDKIRNYRGAQVNLLEYVASHTRLLPRDVVQLGNELCVRVAQARAAGQAQMDPRDVRDCVTREAGHFGNEQLQICVNQLTTDAIPEDAARNDYIDVYNIDGEFSCDRRQQLREFIRSLQAEFGSSDLPTARELAGEMFPETADTLSVLWQNGLLGYRERRGRRKVEVFRTRTDSEFELPAGKESYVLHPTVLSALGISIRRGNHKRAGNHKPAAERARKAPPQDPKLLGGAQGA